MMTVVTLTCPLIGITDQLMIGITERLDYNEVNENKSENDFVGFGDNESFPSARLIELLKH